MNPQGMHSPSLRRPVAAPSLPAFNPQPIRSLNQLQSLATLALLLIALLHGPAASAASPVTLSFQRSWPGGTESGVLSLHLQDDLLFAGQRAVAIEGTELGGLSTYRVLNRTNLIRLGGRLTLNNVEALQRSGAFLYLAVNSSGLQVVDVTDPAVPVHRATLATGGRALGLDLAGTNLYLTDATGLQIIDISRPWSPRKISSLPLIYQATAVEVVNHLAYVTDELGGLDVIDVNDSTAPRWIANCPFGWTVGLANVVTVSGRYAFVSTHHSGGIRVVDLNVPTQPTLIGTGTARGWSAAVVAVGNYVYLADGSGPLGADGLVIFDVADPTNPVVRSTTRLGTDNSSGLQVRDGYAYLGNFWGGMRVFDVQNPAKPVPAAALPAEGFNSLQVIGEHAYLADGAAGVRVVHLGNPMRNVGTCDTPGDAKVVRVAGTRAYVADAAQGLAVLDVADPARPNVLGTCPTLGLSRDLQVKGNHVYLAGAADGLQIYDVSDPHAPYLAARLLALGFPGWPTSIAISGTRAYVGMSGWGIAAVDIHEPTIPVKLGSMALSGTIFPAMTARGSLVYVADYGYGLRIIDFTNPTSPKLVGSFDTGQFADSVDLVGPYALVGNLVRRLDIVNIADPAHPVAAGSYATAGVCRTSQVTGRNVVMLDNVLGLVVADGAPVIDTAPTIYGQPDSLSLFSGTTATFEVTAVGAEPLRYQWRFQGQPIPGATNAILSLPEVRTRNAGNYSVVVSNAKGQQTSNDATLTVKRGQLRMYDSTWRNNTFTTTIETEPFHVYYLEVRDMAADGEWIPLDVVDGDGTEMQLTHRGPAVAARFYRVVRE